MSSTLAETAPFARVPFHRRDGRPTLDDLWLFTGSVCNLRCLHCYTGSSPANRTLEPLGRSDVSPFLAEARALGVRQVYLTGGEPFLSADIVGLLEDSLAVAPTTALTNGTEPLERRLADLRRLREVHGDRLGIRVSLDHYEPERHDAIRRDGGGRVRDAFETTARNVVRLAEMGFVPIVTLSAEVFRGNPVPPAHVVRATRDLFAARGARVEVKILPAVLIQGAQRARTAQEPPSTGATEEDLRTTGTDPTTLMCHKSRLVARRGGRCRIYPCPILVPSDEGSIPEFLRFDLGSSLLEAVERPVELAHPSCATYCCRARGTCGNG
ncbi:MAG: radical SAM protein [Planctomycetales bacterium]|nr:radical SAM protein [Planctomycetales bacterium]